MKITRRYATKPIQSLWFTNVSCRWVYDLKPAIEGFMSTTFHPLRGFGHGEPQPHIGFCGLRTQSPWIAFPTLSSRDGVYDPMKAKRMVERFINLPTEKDDLELCKNEIQSFAEKYGPLGTNQVLLNLEGGQAYAESMFYWRTQIFRLKHLNHIYRLLADNSKAATHELEDLFEGSAPVLFYHHLATYENIELPELDTSRFHAMFQQGTENSSIRATAYYVLVDQIAIELAGNVNLASSLLSGEPFYYIPNNLLGALYLRFSLNAMGSIPELLVCARRGCGKVIEEDHRNTKYCSPSCREMAKYDRKKVRRELAMPGGSIRSKTMS